MENKNEKLTFRPAKKADSKLLFNWVNEEEVRNNSFNIEPVKWESHVDWLCKKLESNQCKIFILEKNAIAVGQIRIEEEETGYWLIDYSIDSNYRGKGYGSIILEELIHKIHNIQLKGVVKKKNIASQRVFEKLSFKAKKRQDLIEYTLHTK